MADEKSKKGKKWKLTMILIIILSLVACGFLLRNWSEPLLWGGWFTALSAASAIFVEGNHRDKKTIINAEVEEFRIKSEAGVGR